MAAEARAEKAAAEEAAAATRAAEAERRATADAERVPSLSSELGAARAGRAAAEAEVARLESTLAKERQERRAAEEAAAGRAAAEAAEAAGAEAVRRTSVCGGEATPAPRRTILGDLNGNLNGTEQQGGAKSTEQAEPEPSPGSECSSEPSPSAEVLQFVKETVADSHAVDTALRRQDAKASRWR